MMKKLRSFLVALLLVPALTLNAHGFTNDIDTSVYTAPEPAQQTTNLCWFYYFGRWVLIPC